MDWLILAVIALLVWMALFKSWINDPLPVDDVSRAISWLLVQAPEAGEVRVENVSGSAVVVRQALQSSGGSGFEVVFLDEGARAAYRELLLSLCKSAEICRDVSHDEGNDSLRIHLAAQGDEAAGWLKQLFDTVRDPGARLTLDSRLPVHMDCGSFHQIEGESVKTRTVYVVVVVGLILASAVALKAHLDSLTHFAEAMWTADVSLAVKWAVFFLGSYALTRFAWKLYAADQSSWNHRNREWEANIERFLWLTAVRAFGGAALFASAAVWAELQRFWWILACVLAIVAMFASFAALGRRLGEGEQSFFAFPRRRTESAVKQAHDLALPAFLTLGTWVLSWHHLWLSA